MKVSHLELETKNKDVWQEKQRDNKVNFDKVKKLKVKLELAEETVIATKAECAAKVKGRNIFTWNT